MEPVLLFLFLFFAVFFRCEIINTFKMALHQILTPGAVAAPSTAEELILLYLIYDCIFEAVSLSL